MVSFKFSQLRVQNYIIRITVFRDIVAHIDFNKSYESFCKAEKKTSFTQLKINHIYIKCNIQIN